MAVTPEYAARIDRAVADAEDRQGSVRAMAHRHGVPRTTVASRLARRQVRVAPDRAGQREALVRLVRDAGTSVADASALVGVHPSTGYRWMAQERRRVALRRARRG